MKVARPFDRHQIQQLRDAIRNVYVEVWDPLRLMDDPEWPHDEYDRYIDGIVSILIHGGSDQEMLDHLDWAVGCMGMDGSRASLQEVIAALRAINWPGKASQSTDH